MTPKTKNGEEILEREYEGVIFLTRKAKGFVRLDETDGAGGKAGGTSGAKKRETEKGDDIEIETTALGTALHNDRVSIRLLPKRFGEKNRSGEVVRVLLRAKVNFAGKLEYRDGILFFVPDDKRVYSDFIVSPSQKIQENQESSGESSREKMLSLDGQKALVQLSEWRDPKHNPRGEIIQVLGRAGEHDAEMRALALERGFDAAFPPAVEMEAEKIPAEISGEEIATRRDMRGIPTCTIDPLTAKDFDDALSVRTLPDGKIEVGIHIADVSHFVRPGTALDKEAGIRGTSVYLVDRTIPMLPERLSNDLCSLRPDEDRLAFSAIFIFAPDATKEKGKAVITDEWFGKTIIRSQRRFVYEDAQEILDANDSSGELFSELSTLRGIARNLEREKKESGAIGFETDELAIEIDENGVPTAIRKKERKEIHRLVEDFMLLANRRVAEFISKIGREEEKLFVYRIHDEPNAERLRELATFVRAFGYRLPIPEDGSISSKDLSDFLETMETTPIRNIVHSTALRSMAKAVYSTKNIGHYGLAFKHYTHFTSPIRRYPDIIAHRLLHTYLCGEKIPKELWEEYESVLAYASEQEKKAADAERDSIKYKQVEFMVAKVGQDFEGVITGVTEWGIFVAEKETLAEGMVSLRDLKNDFYTLDAKRYRLVGERTKKTYALGDAVKMRLARANLAEKTLDYVFRER